MMHTEALGLLVGAVALGAVHGIEPGHGWPVAASYALDQTNKWAYGFAASFILGVGHLTSSIAVVAVFFYVKSYFHLTQINQPIRVGGDIYLGGPVSVVAGLLLIALGIREYRHGHSHGEDPDHHDRQRGHTHDRGEDQHQTYEHSQDDGGLFARLKEFLPFVGGHAYSHNDLDTATDRDLVSIAWFAFLLGFAHEEEFEIIALCAGSNHCLELVTVYAVTVIVAIVGLTMLLIAGYQHYQDTVEQYTPYLPAFSATILSIIGVGFIFGVL